MVIFKNMMHEKHIPQNVRKQRLILGISQPELAKRVGISTNGIQKIEYGKINAPRIDTLLRLASVFRIGVTDLLE